MRNPFENTDTGADNSSSAEDQEAFERRAALRRGGPEADKIREEDAEKRESEAAEKDRERNRESVQSWPDKRKAMEEAIKKTEAQMEELVSREAALEASRKKNDERQFALQSHVDVNNQEQVRALESLRSLRDMDARNLEMVSEEKKKVESRIHGLRSDLESGYRKASSLQEQGF